MLKASELWRVTHLPCFAHTLNLTVTDGLAQTKSKPKVGEPNISDDIASPGGDEETEEEKLTKLLEKCRNIVRFFKKSTLAMDRLMNEQLKKKKKPLKPIQDVATRWNSTLFMLERLLLLYDDDCLTVALCNSSNAPNILHLDEILIIREIVSLLKPFEEATNQISGENYVTVSLIIPLVVGIHTSLQNLAATLKCSVTKNLHSKLLASVIKRLFPYETRIVPRVATLLDPRLKKLAYLNSENANQAQLYVQKELGYLIQNQKAQAGASQEIRLDPTPSTSTAEPSTSTAGAGSTSNLFSFLSQRISASHQTSTTTSDAIISVRQYLESKQLPMRTTNPIEYWASQSNFNPALSELATKFLGIPATSVPSERIFSKAGQIISDRRSNLKPTNVNMLIFLNQNKWLHEQ